MLLLKQALPEELEDSKDVIRIRLSKKKRQYNGQNSTQGQGLLALEYEGVRKFTSFKIGKML